MTPPVVQGQSTQVADFTLTVSRTSTGVVGWQNQLEATAEQVRSGDVYVTPASTVSIHRGHDGAYSIRIPAKKLRTATAVGVRVRATDSDGNSVDQTQYGLVRLR